MPKQNIVKLQIMADGVFVADDLRKDKGDVVEIDPAIAKILIERGHAKPI